MNASALASLPSLDLKNATSGGRKPKALFILDPCALDVIYGEEDRCVLNRLADFYAPPQSKESIRKNPSILAEAEVIFSGWGAPRLDEEFMEAAPNLKALFYGAGTMHYFMTPAFWQREVLITVAADANAIPVAEYCLAAIIMSLKNFWKLSAQAKFNQGWLQDGFSREVFGNFRSTVGFIGLGRVAKKTLELLNPFDIHRFGYSEPLNEEIARKLRVEPVSLDDIFRRSDVISLHAPELPSTRGMIKGRHFELMKPGATFINTARGEVIREGEMIEALRRRPDITAVLDVTCSEPPGPGSLLLKLPNVVLTPHIAGSMGRECERLGHSMLLEFQRYLAGEPLKWGVTKEAAATMA